MFKKYADLLKKYPHLKPKDNEFSEKTQKRLKILEEIYSAEKDELYDFYESLDLKRLQNILQHC